MIGMMSSLTMFVSPFVIISMPFYAHYVLNLEARDMGYLMAISGVGSLGGSLVLLSIPHGRRSLALKLAGLAIFLALCGMASAHRFAVAAASLILLTTGLSITFGTANIVIQERAPDEMRGRVSSIAALSYFGVVVFSGVLITNSITYFGMRPTLVGGAVGYALAAAFLLWGRERLAGAPRNVRRRWGVRIVSGSGSAESQRLPMHLRLSFLLLLAPALIARAADRPNIILVMPDDLGYGDYRCLGNPIINTPAVDAFWKESVRFTDFHLSPTCAPSRSALLTGRHEFKNGVTHTILERERMTLKATTLAQVLKSAGYMTGVFGKWHLGDEEPYQPDHRGFDEMFIHGGGGIGQTYPGSCGDVPGNTYFNPVIKHNHNELVQTQGYCTDVFFAARDRVDGRSGRSA